MKKIIAEVATLLGSTLLLLTVLFTVVQIAMDNNLINRTFLSALMSNDTNIAEEANTTNEVTEANELTESNQVDENVMEEEASEEAEEDELQAYSTTAMDQPATIATTPSNYHDWTELKSLGEQYSYSTLYYTDTTTMTPYWRSVNTIKNETNHNKHQKQQTDINNGKAYGVKLYQGESVDLLIKNCGVDDNFDLFDVVINISNVKSYRGVARYPYSTEVPVEVPFNDYSKPHDDDIITLSYTVDKEARR